MEAPSTVRAGALRPGGWLLPSAQSSRRRGEQPQPEQDADEAVGATTSLTLRPSFEDASAEQLRQAFSASEHLGTPNDYRTAVVCDLIHQLFRAAPQFEAVSGMLRDELFSAVYVDKEALAAGALFRDHSSAKQFFRGTTFFSQVHFLLRQRSRLHESIRELEGDIHSLSHQLASKRRVRDQSLKRWAHTICREAFRGWRSQIVQEKRARAVLEEYFRRFNATKLKGLFWVWKDAVKTAKFNRANAQANQARARRAVIESDTKTIEPLIAETRRNVADLHGRVDELHDTLSELVSKVEAVQENITHSREHALIQISDGWQTAVERLVDSDLEAMTATLEELPASHFPDASLLLEANESLQALDSLDVDRLLLRWARYHLARTHSNRTVHNFSGDLRDSEALGHLLHAVTSATEGVEATPPDFGTTQDPGRRAKELLERLEALGCPRLTTPSAIMRGEADLNVALLAFLFERFPALPPALSGAMGEAVETAVDAAQHEWDALLTTWRSHKRPMVSAVTLAAMQDRLVEARHAVQLFCEQRATAAPLWARVRNRVRTAAWHLLLARGRGTPMAIPDHKAAAEVRSFSDINTDVPSVRNFLAADMELENRDPTEEGIRAVATGLQAQLRGYHSELQRIFRHYAAAGEGFAGTMDADELWTFVKDCRISHKSLLPRKKLLDIYHEIAEDFDGPEANGELEATGFVHVLLCIAATRFSGGNYNTMKMGEKLAHLMDELVLRHACRSNAGQFRAELATEEVHAVVHDFSERLEQIYARYLDEGGAMTARTLNSMLDARGLVDEAFGLTDLAAVCKNVQQDDDLAMGGAAAELNFTEFVEALASIAVYRYPDPFVPLATRFEGFLARDVCVETANENPSRRARRGPSQQT